MNVQNLNCISCKKKILGSGGYVKFKCPECLKVEIVRCKECRIRSIKYVCSACGFEGPN